MAFLMIINGYIITKTVTCYILWRSLTFYSFHSLQICTQLLDKITCIYELNYVYSKSSHVVISNTWHNEKYSQLLQVISVC